MGLVRICPTLFDAGKAFIKSSGVTSSRASCCVMSFQLSLQTLRRWFSFALVAGKRGRRKLRSEKNGAPSGPQHSPFRVIILSISQAWGGFERKFVASPHTISKHLSGWNREALPSQNMFVGAGGDQVEHKPVQRRDA